MAKRLVDGELVQIVPHTSYLSFINRYNLMYRIGRIIGKYFETYTIDMSSSSDGCSNGYPKGYDLGIYEFPHYCLRTISEIPKEEWTIALSLNPWIKKNLLK